MRLLDSGSVSEIRLEDAVAVEAGPKTRTIADANTEPGRGAEARDGARWAWH